MTERVFYATADISGKRRAQMLVLAPLALMNVALFVHRLDWAFALFALVCGMLALTQLIAIRRGHAVVRASDDGLRNYGVFGSRFARWEEMTTANIDPDKKVGTIDYTTTVGKMDHRLTIATGFLGDGDVHALIAVIAEHCPMLITADASKHGEPLIAPALVEQ